MASVSTIVLAMMESKLYVTVMKAMKYISLISAKVHFFIFYDFIWFTDLNECLNDEICDHTCYNTIGSYYCECNTGYELDNDSHTCNGITIK